MAENYYDEDNLLALSGIQHYAYCPRQWALIHVEGQWSESLSTAQGRLVHKRVDNPYLHETRGNARTERSIPLVSKRLGLFGVADLLEIHQQDSGVKKCYTLVEYKKGKPKTDDRDEVQLCAQAICLEEMNNIYLEYGCIYYDQIKQRHQVDFNKGLRSRVEDLSKSMHYFFEQGITPKASKSSKCKNCSLHDICLPKLSNFKKGAKQYIADYINDIKAE
ncbi:MAG: CRISPR-associated protein Cas4 [Bacillota bacterium]